MAASTEGDQGLRLIRRLGIVALALQLAFLLGFSLFIYHRFNLGIDFGIYNQAATQISRGDLNPFSTIMGYPFWKSHFELIVWPLSVLLLIFRSPYILQVVQDFSLTGTGLVLFLWVFELIKSRQLPKRVAWASLLGAALLILVNPLAYHTAAFDFHIEATATFFAVLAAFDIWSGRNRRAIIWLALCLLCGDVGGLYVVGVGISSLLASTATRRMGLVLILVGVGWIGLIGTLGANLGSFITTQYAYLAGRTMLPVGFGGAIAVMVGIVTHPGRPYHILRDRVALIGGYLLPGGVIGAVTPWGFGVPALVLLSSALQSTALFINEPYQQFAVFPFILFGTVSLLTQLASEGGPILVSLEWWSRHRLTRRLAAAIIAVGVVGGALYYAGVKLPKSLKDNAVNGFVPADEASSLRSVLSQTPSGTEVIASVPISGRFSGRKYAYVYLSPTQSIPIRARTIELVMDRAHTIQVITPTQVQRAAQFVTTRFHAHTIALGSDLVVLRWVAPSPHSSIELP